MKRALAVSVGLHVAAFFALMYAPPFSLPALPRSSPSEYQQAFAGKEDKIVWYKFRDLPDIAPQSSPQARQPLRAAVQAKQAIISAPKNAPKRDQVVVTPLPEAELPPLDLPNMIAVKLPPKQFTIPPDLVRPGPPAEIALPDAPQIPAQQLDSAKLPTDRLPPRPFVPPQTPAPTPRAAAKIEAPSEAKEYVALSEISGKLPLARLPSRPFVPPTPQPVPEPRKVAAATEVPALSVNAPAAPVIPPVKLPARAYAPPPAPAPQPKPQIDAPSGDVTVAIATLNPSTIAVKLPAASSPAQFSAGPTVRPDGATSDGADKGINAPDLYAHAVNEATGAKPDLLARTFAAPTSKEFLDDMLRHRQAATSPALATRVSNAPDPRFNGRDVYMMAIQMSNLTSYSGHWLMWYAARSGLKTDVELIAAPVPRRKVDPAYIASAVSDQVEGRVQLYCVIGSEGSVRSIEVLRGVDERLNRSAEEALSKWEFYPATRAGQPVDVDVVVEIPFVLAPPSLLK